MPGRHLVIVESPAKAKTINKYLGDDFQVLASYGHVRDLPPKDGSVRPEDDFEMDWEVGARAKKRMDEIASAAKDADVVYLATDPDREGEAISWHVQEVLKGKRGLGKKPFRRVTFTEITKNAVQHAIENPRDVNDELVEAYLARRALDYLVGFTLSPVLWRKLPGSRSAGRVQSVALRLICERESAIEDFVPREYWSVGATFTTGAGDTVTAKLSHLDGTKLKQFDLASETDATRAADAIKAGDFTVKSVEHKQVTRNPAPPFTTSTLQQEASRKLGFTATQTMRTAQKLYEGIDMGGETVGLITYMRTDGTQLAGEAIGRLREVIGREYGANYVPDSPRTYSSKAKNAQEAHEAIRPTDPGRTPDKLARHLNRAELRLYELIWKRTVACQMAPAKLDQVGVDIADNSGKTALRATGQVIVFDGFLKLYVEGRDDSEDEDGNRLPPLKEGEPLTRQSVDPRQHFTQPPPRFTEASLVKNLEELGIGRPSTYASIIQVLQDRDYVRLESRRFVPEDRGRLVTTFLASFFERYVRYDFTAKLEEQLDDISGGRIDWKTVLRDFWRAFSGAVEETRDLTITQVIDALDAELGPHFFRDQGDGQDPRRCPSCGDGRLGLKLSRNGAFIGCSNYPDCRYTRPLAVPTGDEAEEANTYPRHLGQDPESGMPVTVRKGPYGFYAQLGPAEDADGKGEKPKRVSLPKGYEPASVDLDTALALLGLPRMVGTHPETQKPIEAGVGRYGPYLRHDGAYTSLQADDDVLTVGMNRAMDLLANARKRGGGSTPERDLGAPPDGGQPIAIYKGRYGPYLRQGKSKVMASLPKGREINDITLEEAVELLEAKKAGGSGGRKASTQSGKTSKSKSSEKSGGKKAGAKTAGDKKSTAKKPGTKKSGAKKTGAKKSASKKPDGE